MPDIADDRAAFREALRRAEEGSGITRDPETGEEVYGETPAATPEPEDTTLVAASDQPLEPEAVEETDTSEQVVEPAAPEAPAAPTLEELQSKLAEAEARLAEKESFIGRQSGEVGELRKAVDELSARVTQQSQPATQPAPSVVITQDLIDSNPGAAVQAAYAQGNNQALEIAFAAWRDEDPFNAASWLSDRKLEQQQAAFDAKLAETRAEIEKVTPVIAENAEQKQWTEAFAEMQKTYPDFQQNAVKLLEEVAPQFPSIAKLIAEGDAATKVEGLALLYEKSKLGDPEAVRAELAAEALAAAAEEAATRAGAAVVNRQTTVGQNAVEKTDEELEQEAYLTRMGRRPSLASGWTGRKA